MNGEMPLYHMDVYRLDDVDEDIGVEDYYNKSSKLRDVNL